MNEVEVIAMKFASASNSMHKYGKLKPKYNKKIEKKHRIGSFLFYFLIIMICAGLIYQSLGTNMELKKYKMDGQLISVGNHRLMVNTTGYGNYAAVLLGDTGSAINQWDKVKEGLSKEMKVFTYDRSGFGWSDSPESYADISKTADILRVALFKTGMPRPYILVAHGYGGLIATKYAEKYPEDVAGIVLVDSLMESQVKTQDYQKSIESEIKKYNAEKIASYFGIMRLGYKTKLLSNDSGYLSKLSQEQRDLYNCQRGSAKYYKAYLADLNNIKNYSENTQASNALKKKYLVVITSNQEYDDAAQNSEYISQQKKLLSMSKKSQQILVKGSGSYIQVDKPNAVVDAVNSIYQEVNR